MHWFADFLYLYALGIVGAATLVPERAIGRYFYKFHYAIALVLVIIATFVELPIMAHNTRPLRAAADLCALAFSGIVLLMLPLIALTKVALKPALLWIPVSVGSMYAAFAGFASGSSHWAGILVAVHFLTMAAVLGSVLVAMILGHWYLQNAALSFDHLTRLSRFFLAAVVARVVVSAIFAVVGYDRLQPLLSDFDLVYIGTRVGAGLVGGLVLGWMTLSCAKSKANQSATGILYVAVVFILVGEVMSMYLTLKRGVPL